MTEKRQLTISLSGASACGKTRTAAMLHYLFDQAGIEVVHQSGDAVHDFSADESGEELLQWLTDNVKILLVDYRT